MRKIFFTALFTFLLALSSTSGFGAESLNQSELKSISNEIKEIKVLLNNYLGLKLAHDVRIERFKIQQQNIKDIQTELETINDELQNKNDEKLRLTDQIDKLKGKIEFDPEANKSIKDELSELNASLKVVERQEQRLFDKKVTLEAKKSNEESILRNTNTQLEISETDINSFLQKNK